MEGKKKIPVDLETAVFAKYVKYKEVEGCQNLFKVLFTCIFIWKIEVLNPCAVKLIYDLSFIISRNLLIFLL